MMIRAATANWRNTICSSHADSASASQDCGGDRGYLHDTVADENVLALRFDTVAGTRQLYSLLSRIFDLVVATVTTTTNKHDKVRAKNGGYVARMMIVTAVKIYIATVPSPVFH
jgi:hypothetical protein